MESDEDRLLLWGIAAHDLSRIPLFGGETRGETAVRNPWITPRGRIRILGSRGLMRVTTQLQQRIGELMSGVDRHYPVGAFADGERLATPLVRFAVKAFNLRRHPRLGVRTGDLGVSEHVIEGTVL